MHSCAYEAMTSDPEQTVPRRPYRTDLGLVENRRAGGMPAFRPDHGPQGNPARATAALRILGGIRSVAVRAVLRSGAARHRAPSSARHPPKQPSHGARMRESGMPEQLDAWAQLKLKVSPHSRLQVTPPVRKITSVPQQDSLRWQDRLRSRGAAVNCALRGARDESGVLRNRAESRPSASRP